MPRKTFRKIITSAKNWLAVNPKNKELMKNFIDEKRIRCSDTTIKNYISDLEIFLTWNLLYNENIFYIDIKKMGLSKFFAYVTNELMWNSSRFLRMRSVLSSLSEFIERMYDDEFPNFRNFVGKAIQSMPKISIREKTVLSEEQIDKLFLELEDNPEEQCLLALLISSGARISEILRITTDMIDENNVAFNGLFLETKKKIKTKGRTKSGDMKYKYIIKDTFLKYYKKWYPIRENVMLEKGTTHNCVFLKQDSSPAEVSTLNSRLRRWEKLLGIDLYFHGFRHFCVTHLTRLGLSSDLIIELMGWKSGGAMYAIYNDLEAKDREWNDLDKLSEYLKK